jgi:hypothetical protein
MTDTNSLDYFLFPHMTLSSSLLENLCVFLPHLNILEIISKVSIPEWAMDRLHGYAVFTDPELSSRIKSSLEGYRDFAKVRGGPGGVLGFLRQALDEMDESRYRIQEELRGKFAPDKDDEDTRIVQASLFLEMARELDEKELEIQAGFDRVNTVEQEFRDILGIEDEESEPVGVDLLSTLVHDENGLLFMLEKRIESWLRVFAARPVANTPVFVTGFPEVALEALEIIRTGCERGGKDFSTASYMLGPLPFCLPPRDVPGVSDALSACRRGLDDFIGSAARGEEPEKTETKRRLLQNAFEELFARCEQPVNREATLQLTVVKNICAAAIPGLPARPLTDEPGTWPPVFLTVQTG